MAKQNKVHYYSRTREYIGFGDYRRTGGWACDYWYRGKKDSTTDVYQVTCKRCKGTKVYKRVLKKKQNNKYPLFKGIKFQFVGRLE
jgi:hypothetical protein